MFLKLIGGSSNSSSNTMLQLFVTFIFIMFITCCALATILPLLESSKIRKVDLTNPTLPIIPSDPKTKVTYSDLIFENLGLSLCISLFAVLIFYIVSLLFKPKSQKMTLGPTNSNDNGNDDAGEKED